MFILYLLPIRFVRFENKSVNQRLPVLGAGQRSQSLVLTKGIVSSGEESTLKPEAVLFSKGSENRGF